MSLAFNSRSDSSICVLCKLVEHVLFSNSMAHVEEHKLLSDRQHAFRISHCCETQFAILIVAKSLDNQCQVDRFIFIYF